MAKLVQTFHAGDMLVRCAMDDLSRSTRNANSGEHLVVWRGKFDSQEFGFLVDSAMDVVQNGSFTNVDVTGIKLAAGSTFCFAQGDVPAGLPPGILYARTEQMLFWEHFVRHAKGHGMHLSVIDASSPLGAVALGRFGSAQ
jgi:hypothetical protein